MKVTLNCLTSFTQLDWLIKRAERIFTLFKNSYKTAKSMTTSTKISLMLFCKNMIVTTTTLKTLLF